jgi:hypothetical protein
MILVISIVDPRHMLAHPLTFINVTTSCDQGLSKRGASQFRISRTPSMSFLETPNLQNSEIIHIRSKLDISPSDQWLQSNMKLAYRVFGCDLTLTLSNFDIPKPFLTNQ